MGMYVSILNGPFGPLQPVIEAHNAQPREFQSSTGLSARCN